MQNFVISFIDEESIGKTKKEKSIECARWLIVDEIEDNANSFRLKIKLNTHHRDAVDKFNYCQDVFHMVN